MTDEYLIEPPEDDDDRHAAFERALAHWVSGPVRPRRDMTTVELPHFADDDALGNPHG